MVAIVFFVAPALAVHAAGKPLFAVIEDSLGSVPALSVRLCAVAFLVSWLAEFVSLPLRIWSNNLEMQVTALQQWGVAVAAVTFLFMTGCQSLQTLGKLATFTNKLGFAMLIAALVRIHDGWPAVFSNVKNIGGVSWVPQLWSGTLELAFYVAPIGLLCCSFASRLHGRRQLAIAGMSGMAVPVFLTLLLVAVIGTATHASSLYQPSLQPTVAMALWSHTARSAVPGRMLVAAVTVFGAGRLASRLLADAIVAITPRRWPGRLLMILFVLGTAWLSLDPFSPVLTATLNWPALCLGLTSAVLTADFMIRAPHVQRKRRVAWTGSCAVLVGLTAPLCVTGDPVELSLNRWFLPSFLISFVICTSIKVVQRTGHFR
jgi:hypothetical protein